MFDLLDVAIGLIFVFTLLSLITSALSEAISGMLSWRGKILWRALDGILGKQLREVLEVHPLIRGLAQGRRLSPAQVFGGRESEKASGRSLPSYLEGEMFALALLQHAFNARANVETGQPGDLTDLRQALRKYVVKPSEETLDENLKAFRPFAGALLALIDDAANVEEAKQKIAAWYDAAMERLSGLYKRWMQWIMFGIGLGLAFVLGVDALAIANGLWENPALRASTVELASSFTEASETEALENARIYATTLQQTRLPLFPWSASENGFAWLWAHGLGFVLTALATAMGAPFWFDLLSRFISLRTSVKPTPKQGGAARPLPRDAA